MKKLKEFFTGYEKYNPKGKQMSITFWVILLAAMLTKYTYYGIRYFPVFDDNNMYGVFSYKSPFFVLDHYKMYTTRPIAAFLDAFVYSRLWGNMFILLFIMILLHFLCCVLTWKIFEMNNLKFGIFACIFLGMLPYGMEATYWIAASSRIVVGLFFSLLSMYILMLYIHSPKNANKKIDYKYLIAFFITNLVSFGFYEQIIVLCFFGCLILCTANFKRISNKLILLVPFINLIAILTFYGYFSSVGNMATRGQIVKRNFIEHTLAVFSKIRDHLQYGQIHMYKQGLFKGIRLLIDDKAVLFAILAITISLFVVHICKNEKYDTSLKTNSIKLVLGIFLIIIPFAPFFLLETVWMASRNSFLSFLGLALVSEAIINIILRGKYLAILRGIIAGVFVLFFIIINTARISEYRATYNTDNLIISEFVDNLNKIDGSFNENSTVIIFNTEKTYIDPTGPNIWSCTGNYWAFMGALKARTGDPMVSDIFPVKNNTTLSLPEDRLRSSIYLGMNIKDLKIFPLKGKWENNNTLVLRLQDGSIFGNVQQRSGDRFFFKLAR